MDNRLQLDTARREGATDELAGQPLVTVAWRTQRAFQQRDQAVQVRRTGALAQVADRAFRLRKIAGRLETGEGEHPGFARELTTIADEMEAALQELGMLLVAPAGEPYAGQLLDVLENMAQLPSPEITEPHVAEIVTPALLYRGALYQMGKAIIAVPEAQVSEADDLLSHRKEG